MNRDIKNFNDNSLIEEKSYLQSEIDWLNGEINHLEKENNQLSEYLDELRAEYSTVVPNLQDDIKRLNQKLIDLEEEKERLGKGNEAKRGYQLDIVDLEEDVVDQKAEISELEELNKKHTEKLKSDQFTIAKLEHELENSNQKLAKLESELEFKVKMLNNEIVALEQERKEFSIDAEKIKPLTDYIDTLENNIAEFKDKIDHLELENKKLREIVATEEYTQIPPRVEENILRLQKRVAELIQDNKDLTEKNSVLLKAALLLDVDVEAVERSTEVSTSQIEEPPQIAQKEGKVQDLVNEGHIAIDIQGIPEGLDEILEEILEEFEEKPLLIAEKYETEEPESVQTTTNEANELDSDVLNVEEIIIGEGRKWECPICGNQDKKLIREIIDRSRVISAFAGLYGKKFKCGKCGTEWH